MLILCSGPDTYRAREKARELTAAFKTKYDQSGLATEVLDVVDLGEVLSRLGAGSLFAQKKFIRADGILKKLKIAEVRILAAKLETDKDQTILLTVEDEVPTEKVMETLKCAPLVHYPYPFQTGVVFKNWVRSQAEKIGVSMAIADQIATHAEGDSWLAITELQKHSVYSQDEMRTPTLEASVFELADMVLTEKSGWRRALEEADDEGVLSVAVTQARSYLRARDGSVDGLHPYVVRKMKGLRISQPEKRFLELMRALVASRSGLANGEEAESLL